jgi:hypothetical protein
MRALKAFDGWVQTEYATPASSLGLYRIVFSLVMLVIAIPNGYWVSSFPNSFFVPPPGPTFFFFHGFPGPLSFHVMNGALVFLTVCLLFGYCTRGVSVLFSVTFMGLRAWEYSFGKINHDFMLLLIPLLLSAAGWGNYWSVDRSSEQEPDPSAKAGPIALYAFIVATMMLLAGIPKVLSGWLNPHSRAVLGDIIVSHFITGRATWFSQMALELRSSWFWKSLDWFTCALEIAFIFAFFRRSRLRVVCAIAAFFHLGVSLLMKIYFWGNLMAYGAFADWDEMCRFFPYNLVRKLAGIISGTSRIRVLTIATLVTTIYSIFGNPLANLMGKIPDESESQIGLCIVVIGAATGLVYLIRPLRTIRVSVPKASPAIADR